MKFAMDPQGTRRTTPRSRAIRELWNKSAAYRAGLHVPKSTYIAKPPFFDGFSMQPDVASTGVKARVRSASSVIRSPLITSHRPAPLKTLHPRTMLIGNNVLKADFNSYGARRGNHEVMMRGTFANVRIKNLMIPQQADGSRIEGGFTLRQPSGELMSIYDAAMKYIEDGVPTIVFGGEEYGTGSSRDWAAKGTQYLASSGDRAQLRAHPRRQPGGMGVLPLQFVGSDSANR